jgi:hypothetical protein
MPILRRRIRIHRQAAELAVLDRAEHLCDRAEVIYTEAVAQADFVLAKAKADAARLLRETLALVDENLARSEAARRQHEDDQAAAYAARAQAERVLGSARAMQETMSDEVVTLRALA